MKNSESLHNSQSENSLVSKLMIAYVSEYSSLCKSICKVRNSDVDNKLMICTALYLQAVSVRSRILSLDKNFNHILDKVQLEHNCNIEDIFTTT